jgi:hypothetical protein
LIAYEELPYGGGDNEIEIDGYSQEQVLYHQEILEEAGYIKAIIEKSLNGLTSIFPERLTYAGHEFLNSSRNDSNWEKTKNVMLKSGGFVMEIAKALLISEIRDQLHLP